MLTFDPEPKTSTNYVNYIFNSIITPTIFYKDDNILVLDNVLSDSECNDIINFKDNTKYKICINFNDLSNIIDIRCESILQYIYNYQNNWYYKNINPNWRLVESHKNRKLSKHFDGVNVISVDEKSIYTIMIYLKDSDGDLKFNDTLQFTPKCGRVVIFNQSLLHEGLENKNHIKYFIRSELIFTRNISIESFNDKLAMELYTYAKLNPHSEESKLLEEKAFELSELLENIILNI